TRAPPRVPRGPGVLRVFGAGMGDDSSQVLDPACHLYGFENLPDEDEALDDLADGFGVLGAIRDARVRDARGVEAEEVLVLGEEDAAFGQAVSGLVLIDRTHEPRLGRRRDVDAATPQSPGDCLAA